MEKPEYFVVRPSIKTFGGVKVTKDTCFETENDDKTIKQTLKDLVLTTTCDKETEFGGIKSTEHSVLTTEVPEGTVLIWGEDTGYIIPNYVMIKPEEAVEMLNQIKDITKPIEESNKVESED